MIHSILQQEPAPRVPKTFVRMFMPRFQEPIIQGLKPHTVRPRPLRLPEPDDIISCRVWEGRPYRTPQREFFRGTITKVEDFLLMRNHSLYRMRVEHQWLRVPDAEAFAKCDGFSGFAEMQAWFEKTHNLQKGPFEGVVIHWVPLEGGQGDS